MVYSLNTVDNLSNILDSYEFFDSSVIDKNNFINIVIEIIKSIEFFGIDTIIYTKKLIHNNFKDRDYYIISMDLMILFYYDVILKMLERTTGTELILENRIVKVDKKK